MKKNKKKLSEEEIEEVQKIVEPKEEITLEKELKLQYDSKQFFIRIPKNFETLLKLKKGMKIKLISTIPSINKDAKIKTEIEVLDG